MPVVTRFSSSAKKAVEQYFVRPAYYLFFLLLSLGAIALLVGKEPPVKFWILLAVIGVLNITPNKSASAEPSPKAAKNSNAKRSK